MKFEELGKIAGCAMTKEPHELTDEERLAIVFMAGGDLETAWTDDHRYVMRTRHPVALHKIDGKWRVNVYQGAKLPSLQHAVRTGAEHE